MEKKITFITGNPDKLKEVLAIIGDDYSIVVQKIDLTEIQAKDSESIIRAKCREATTQVQGAVIVEDTSLCFNGYKGLPGPYIKWFYEEIGNDGLNAMIDGVKDKTAYASCIFGLCEGPEAQPILFEGITEVRQFKKIYVCCVYFNLLLFTLGNYCACTWAIKLIWMGSYFPT